MVSQRSDDWFQTVYQTKLQELQVTSLSVQPFVDEEDWGAPPVADPATPLNMYEEWVFYEVKALTLTLTLTPKPRVLMYFIDRLIELLSLGSKISK